MYKKLRAFKQEHKNCHVPNQNVRDPQLGNWTANQRGLLSRGELRQDRKALLDSLGFDWSPSAQVFTAIASSQWEERFQELVRFKQSNGHCRTFPDHPLSAWASQQRNRKFNPDNNDGRRPITQEESDRLDAIGFEWIPRDWDEHWNAKIRQLKRYKMAHGNCLVPKRFKEDPQLGQWVVSQRGLNKIERLGKERQAELDSIGFVWMVRDCSKQSAALQQINDDKWNKMYEKLCLFADTHGDCLVPTERNYEDKSLGTWVVTQRSAFKNNTLKANRMEKLDDVNFVWKVNHYDSESSVAILKPLGNR
mmetsp:Transcript_24312/g.40303  ORF Transcript_24312/g.40303 Transcript_24312/m.40303 type:complete len:307 (+) Transcript_24312:459-1379(+)